MKWLITSMFIAVACAPHAPPQRSTPLQEVQKPSARGTLRVAVISDLNGRYGSVTYGDPVHDAVARILELEPDLVVSSGDMVAGQRSGLDYRDMWEGFHAVVSNPLAAAGIPLAVSPGNHDASGYPEFVEEREIYVDEWLARKPSVTFVDDARYPLEYAFVVGPALFIALDATKSGPLSAQQHRWLDAILTRHQSTPVKVVFGHLPIYPVAEGRAHEALRDTALEDLLQDHRVDLYVSGHHHSFYPSRRGDLRLLSVACLGGGARALLGEEERSERGFVVLELDASGVLAVDAYAGPGLRQRLDWTSLPETLGQSEERLWRDEPPEATPVRATESKGASMRVLHRGP